MRETNLREHHAYMRLKYLKLAGFKSFVDPTKIEFTQALSAVVGPNGCGKSNIIDAVRWVLGESSAKNLRGEGMTDVIFNGSSARKPVSNASVELMFDNTQGKAAGPWATYTDIAIKRQVNRDGQSDYFVNGQKCRRRDISDLLSGTGLGPRSYSIIEQGTISRLVESKPQELRVFIEEAAGITKYKERKRDTENRIRHSRENLARLADLRHELQGQIASLETQAQLAQDYTTLKQQERELNQNIIVARWQSFFNELEQVAMTLAQQQTQMAQLENDLAHLQTTEAARGNALSDQRQALDALNTKCNNLETDIARMQLSIEHLTQTMQHAENKHSELALKLDALSQQKQGQEETLTQAEQVLAQSTQALPDYLKLYEKSQQDALEQEAEAEHSEQAFVELQHERQRLNSELLIAKQGHEQVVQDRIKLTSQLEMVKEKQLELVSAQQQLNPQALEKQVQYQQHQVNAVAQSVETHEQQIANVRVMLTSAQTKANKKQQQLSELQNRQSTLALIVKQQTQPESNRLKTHYSDTPQLWSLLDVEPQWQHAAQTILKPVLTAFVVDSLTTTGELPRHTVMVKHTSLLEQRANTNTRLSCYIACQDPAIKKIIDDLCYDVHVANDLEQANQLLPNLGAKESVVTMQGWWLSHSFCVIGDDTDEATGASLLALKQQQQELISVLQRASEQFDISLEEVEEAERQLTVALENKKALEQDYLLKQQEMLDTKQRWLLEQQQWQHLSTGLDDVMVQHTQTMQLFEIEKNQQGVFKQEISQLTKALSTTEEQLKLAQSARQIAKQQLKLLQTKQQQAQSKVHQQQMLVQKHQLKHDGCQAQLVNISAQKDDLNRELAAVAAQQESATQPLTEKKHKLKLCNQQLFTLRGEQQAQQVLVKDSIKASADFTQQWQHSQQMKDQLQGQIEKFRVKQETLKVKISAQEQALEVSQREMAQLAQSHQGGNSKSWANELAVIRDKLAQMGAINLTAIEQYNEQKGRLDYLTQQNDDLEQGLKTLESAIRKIDRQSREKFKATFDSVNNDFKALFPKVFGGGSAQLTLTDSDLLLSGVSIMAQPPGKKNSTIALLSGGEKALTALSLVFAIFQLNPAPFCMLDEVDAPLDDANVDRYCTLVKEMSEKVQFIYITHNKVSMEMATQLTGVTMQEAGISRVVTVDVDEAVSLAQQ